MAGTKLGDLYTHLLATWRADAALSEVAIEDGPPSTDMTAPKMLVVGWGGDYDDPDSGGLEQAWKYAGSTTRSESLSLTCWLSVAREDDMSVLRTEAIALFTAAVDSLRASPAARSASGALFECAVSGARLWQSRDTRGASAGFVFNVTATNHT